MEVEWKGGGGYKFYELAPPLVVKDEFGEEVINSAYDANMLAAAVALHEGYTFKPDPYVFWKQAVAHEKSYLFVTTNFVSQELVMNIANSLAENEYLLIACSSYDSQAPSVSENITIKKIPQILLDRCEYTEGDYNLNIISPPAYDDEKEGCDE